MRIVVIEFMSLDGVVQAPGGAEEDTDGGFAHGGWTHPFFDPDVVGGAFAGALTEAGALLFGRRTWQGMAAAWPERAGDPFAGQMNAISKYVVSETLRDDELTWKSLRNVAGVHVLTEDQLNTYDVLASDHVVFTEQALTAFVSRSAKEASK